MTSEQIKERWKKEFKQIPSDKGVAIIARWIDESLFEGREEKRLEVVREIGALPLSTRGVILSLPCLQPPAPALDPRALAAARASHEKYYGTPHVCQPPWHNEVCQFCYDIARIIQRHYEEKQDG